MLQDGNNLLSPLGFEPPFIRTGIQQLNPLSQRRPKRKMQRFHIYERRNSGQLLLVYHEFYTPLPAALVAILMEAFLSQSTTDKDEANCMQSRMLQDVNNSLSPPGFEPMFIRTSVRWLNPLGHRQAKREMQHSYTYERQNSANCCWYIRVLHTSPTRTCGYINGSLISQSSTDKDEANCM